MWSSLLLLTFVAQSVFAAGGNCSFWLEDIKHQGFAAYNVNASSFKVFRNVKDYGAVGDGMSDDTAAINMAISSGPTCATGSCLTSSNAHALVYFPYGTYKISSTVIQNYGVTLYGNPNCMPTIKASSNFTNGPGEVGLIDGDPVDSTGKPYYPPTRIFHRQLRNLVIDTTSVDATKNIAGCHWPSAQSTNMQNVVFNMPTVSGVNHTGMVVDGGGMMLFNDLVFNGGSTGFYVFLSQIVMRNLTFNDCNIGLDFGQLWSLSASQMYFNNCTTGIRNVVGDGEMCITDSFMTNTKTGIASNYGNPQMLRASNSIILENIQVDRVPVVVQNAGNATSLMGSNDGTKSISGYGQGNSYHVATPGEFAGPMQPVNRPAGLRSPNSNDWYFRSKPQYGNLPASSFISARTSGARGDGMTDDTKAMQAAIYAVANSSKVLFLDQGSYKITSTLIVPSGTRMVGEAFPKVFAAGPYFGNVNDPKPMMRVGAPGEKGHVEFSDILISAQGPTAGAILVEHHLASTAKAVGGYWDVDAIIGGWNGSQLSVEDCPPTPQLMTPPVNESCMSTFMVMHITPSASGVYMENCWLWNANFDLDSANGTNLQVYSGRGLLVDSEEGNNWFVCVPVEHHSKYQYNLVDTKNIYMDHIQSETPYYQPNPIALYPYPQNASLHDPVYVSANSSMGMSYNSTSLALNATPAANPVPIVASVGMAWAAVIANSSAITMYSAAFSAWYNNFGNVCKTNGTCQQSPLSIDEASSGITIYGFTYGNMQNAVTSNGTEIIPYLAGEDRFNTIAMFKQD